MNSAGTEFRNTTGLLCSGVLKPSHAVHVEGLGGRALLSWWKLTLFEWVRIESGLVCPKYSIGREYIYSMARSKLSHL